MVPPTCHCSTESHYISHPNHWIIMVFAIPSFLLDQRIVYTTLLRRTSGVFRFAGLVSGPVPLQNILQEDNFLLTFIVLYCWPSWCSPLEIPNELTHLQSGIQTEQAGRRTLCRLLLRLGVLLVPPIPCSHRSKQVQQQLDCTEHNCDPTSVSSPLVSFEMPSNYSHG